MRCLSLLILVAATTVSASEWPNCELHYRFPSGYCGEGISSDSFGRGREAGIVGDDAGPFRPVRIDECCFAVGLHRGKEMKAGRDTNGLNAKACREDFDAGRKNGYQIVEPSSGSICFNEGYQSGASALNVHAREGNTSVGPRCLDFYARGLAAGRSGGAGTADDAETNRERACYVTGFFDGTL